MSQPSVHISRAVHPACRWIFGIMLASLLLIGLTTVLFTADASDRKAGDARKNRKDGADMVWVPAGEFLMGTSDAQLAKILQDPKHPDYQAEWFKDEMPQHKVRLDGFWVYKYEVTVGQYRKFCRDTDRKLPEQPKWSADNYPVVNVSWLEASAYAEWAGGRLPTEAEWEKAARGDDGRRFPWGDAWSPSLCRNYSAQNAGKKDAKDKNAKDATEKKAAPVGSYPKGASPYGAEDMAGNVWEWCQDWYAPDYYKQAQTENPTGPDEGELRVMRGGSWGSSSKTCSTTGRNAEEPDLTYHDDGGFRCVVPGK